MIAIILLFSIGACSIRLEGQDRIAGLSFSGLFLAHEVFLVDMAGFWYCASDAGICLFILGCLSSLKHTEYIEKLMGICLLLIVFNFVAWIVWAAYLPVEIVNWCFHGLYAITCYLTVGGRTDGNANRNTVLHSGAGKGYNFLHEIQKEGSN